MENKGLLVTADIYLSEAVGDDEIVGLCEKAIAKSKMTIVSTLKELFKPYGVTSLWLLSESHFSVHTYPEHKYLSVDCYTCGSEGDPVAAINYLLDSLPVEKSKVTSNTRG